MMRRSKLQKLIFSFSTVQGQRGELMEGWTMVSDGVIYNGRIENDRGKRIGKKKKLSQRRRRVIKAFLKDILDNMVL